MALGVRIPLDSALKVAEGLARDLRPVTERVEIAGSVRRRRPYVSDIELVCEPLVFPDLFGKPEPAIQAIRKAVRGWGEWAKGGERYMQIELPDGLRCDVFICHPPAEWGPLFAIRTGPARLSQYAVTELHRHGLQCVDGHIVRKADSERLPCPDEETFFRYAGLRYLAPEQRDAWDAMRAGAR